MGRNDNIVDQMKEGWIGFPFVSGVFPENAEVGDSLALLARTEFPVYRLGDARRWLLVGGGFPPLRWVEVPCLFFCSVGLEHGVPAVDG